MQYLIIFYSPDFFFPQAIFNLIYTLVRILTLENIASPQAFHYAAAAAVIFVTKKKISPGVTTGSESQLLNISRIEIWLLYIFSWRGEMWGQNFTVYFMLHYSVILDPKISTIPMLVMNGM